MRGHETWRVTRVKLAGQVPVPPTPATRGRGRPPTDPDRLCLQAVVRMLVRHLPTGHALLSVLAQPTPEMPTLRVLWTGDGRFPPRRTWERRLQAMPVTLPAQIGCLGRALVAMIRPWARCGRAAALDRTVRRARGGGWYQKDREAGIVPHPSSATAAHWTQSGGHGWVDGWTRHLVTTVAHVWIPLAAELTAANVADHTPALIWRPEWPAAVRSVLGDQHDHAPALHAACVQAAQTVVATRQGSSPPTADGVEGRRLLPERRSRAIEHLHEQVNGLFDAQGQVPTKGLVNTRRFALGAVLVSQLILWDRHEHGRDRRVGLTPFLKAA